MPKVDFAAVPRSNRTGYPEPFASDVAGRLVSRLGDIFGLQDFGASHVILEPGAMSSQRHWHEDEDELVVMLSGEAVLIEDEGRSILHPGDCAVFPKGVANGHHLVNESGEKCIFVAIGRTAAGPCHYPDVDLHYDGASRTFVRKDGRPYSAAAS
ncbi:cupin domain-containing protein [Sphingosinicella rhizophila]|uniref:Cupin domain-containing protein n=1 Tax=Sphingosinicella rhizophila TaxID=3050082 RepID=A0ABU3Q9L4_9SPHN|nr:cupin domain-containing protein [Sphingosinicella sp. GR2756]MDT9599987.1 cupin domain-containing protein [Sphingosinicella sp. GR2756]